MFRKLFIMPFPHKTNKKMDYSKEIRDANIRRKLLIKNNDLPSNLIKIMKNDKRLQNKPVIKYSIIQHKFSFSYTLLLNNILNDSKDVPRLIKIVNDLAYELLESAQETHIDNLYQQTAIRLKCFHHNLQHNFMSEYIPTKEECEFIKYITEENPDKSGVIYGSFTC